MYFMITQVNLTQQFPCVEILYKFLILWKAYIA